MKQLNLIFESTLKSSGGSKIPVGVYNDGQVIMDGVTKGDTFYDINYRMGSQTIHKRLFDITQANPKEGQSEAEAISEREDRQLAFLIHLCLQFFDYKELENMKAKTYKEFADMLMAKINTKKGERVNLKVTVDYKEKKYPSIPSYPEHVFKYEGVPGTLVFSKKELEEIGGDKPKEDTNKYV